MLQSNYKSMKYIRIGFIYIFINFVIKIVIIFYVEILITFVFYLIEQFYDEKQNPFLIINLFLKEYKSNPIRISIRNLS